jgi:hypothetical protein
MKNEEQQRKFKAKKTSDEKVKSKIVKSDIRVSIYGLETGKQF